MITKNLYLGDCLEVMRKLPDKSIHMILCDLPYGTTNCKWDAIIPFEPLWEQYKRIIIDNGAIALTASQPFTSKLVMSNIKMFKYEWIWAKDRPTGFLNAKHMPMKYHENICMFYKKPPIYNPIKTKNHKPMGTVYKRTPNNNVYNINIPYKNYGGETERFPGSIQKFNTKKKPMHPSQKPVALFEYLIKTYTNEGMIVLDNCAGSGTTAIACLNTNRNFILIEKEEKYYNIIRDRIGSYFFAE